MGEFRRVTSETKEVKWKGVERLYSAFPPLHLLRPLQSLLPFNVSENIGLEVARILWPRGFSSRNPGSFIYSPVKYHFFFVSSRSGVRYSSRMKGRRKEGTAVEDKNRSKASSLPRFARFMRSSAG